MFTRFEKSLKEGGSRFKELAKEQVNVLIREIKNEDKCDTACENIIDGLEEAFESFKESLRSLFSSHKTTSNHARRAHPQHK